MINTAPLARFGLLGDGRRQSRSTRTIRSVISQTPSSSCSTGAQRGPLLPTDCFGGAYPRAQKIVLIFLDLFGWEFWQTHGSRFRATRRVAETGTLTPISALFPSTTAASVSTMNLGVLPAAHALYEWNIYIPAYGEVIQSLAFCPLGRHPQDACRAKGYDPARLLEVHETVHQRLAAKGVRSVQFAHRSYAGSAYNTVASVGAKIVRHSTMAEGPGAAQGGAGCRRPARRWLSFYWAAIDSIAHTHGPGRSYHAAEIASFWRTFDEIFRRCGEPRHALSLHRRPRPRRRRRDGRRSIINERWPETRRVPAAEPHGQPDLPQRLAARRVPARTGRAPRRTCWGQLAPGARRHRAGDGDGGRRWPRGCSVRGRRVPSCGGGSAISWCCRISATSCGGGSRACM